MLETFRAVQTVEASSRVVQAELMYMRMLEHVSEQVDLAVLRLVFAEIVELHTHKMQDSVILADKDFDSLHDKRARY